MIRSLHRMGLRSSMMYTAGMVSVGASFVSWLISKQYEGDLARADRWGLFVGEWAPTFFALGVALRMEETREEAMGGPMDDEHRRQKDRMAGRRAGSHMTSGV
jgi:hypothetical protein